MSDSTVRLRIMLQGYEQQLLAARRLAKFKAKQLLQAGLDPEQIDPPKKRPQCVEKVTNELYNCLLYTGSENPIVEEIRQELSRVLGTPVCFTYPPGKRLVLVWDRADGKQVMSNEEQLKARMTLLQITREKVNASMLTDEQT